MKIGYQGVNGAFSQMALRKYFSLGNEEIGYSSFLQMFSDVEKGILDYALFVIVFNFLEALGLYCTHRLSLVVAQGLL